MAHKCNTLDKPWDSKINNIAEGQITIEREGGDGIFRGRHRGKNQDIRGQCFEEGGGRPHRLFLLVPAHNPEFLYAGVINDAGDEINGKRFTFSAFVDTLANDDWTAEKPPTDVGTGQEESR